MSTTIVLFLLVLSFVWAIGSVYYQGVIRPLVADRVRFALFANRDKLRTMAINHEIAPESFTYQYLEDLLNKLVHASSWMSVGSLIEFRCFRQNESTPPEILRFDAEATESLKQIERDALKEMILVMAVNSPWWIGISALVALIDWIRRGAIWASMVTANRVLWHTSDLNRLMPAR